MGEEHSALCVCIFELDVEVGDWGRRDTREGDVHRGQWTNLCSGVKVLAWSMNSFSLILDGDTNIGPELLGFLSLLAEVGDDDADREGLTSFDVEAADGTTAVGLI